MARRAAIVVALAALLTAGTPHRAWAHAGLISSEPAGGATLGDTPTAVQLSFSEPPEPSLSTITVLDSKGVSYQSGPPAAVAGDPLSLEVPVHLLLKGVYTVDWRVDSAIDGHATTGAFAFGVQVSPGQLGSARGGSVTAVSSLLELIARWIFLVGMVALLGAATAGVAGFGGSGRQTLALGAGGWGLSVVGLLLLADAQRRNAGSSYGVLLHTSVGHALIWRAVALAGAGAALLIAARGGRIRRPALLAAALAALAAVVVHVANGHAAAASWPSTVTVIAQVTHFAVAGVWVGGLAALLLGLRGDPSASKQAAVRRFSTVAAAGLALVIVTGVIRAFSELRTWSELFSTGYGRGVLAKLALVAIIAGLGLRNRRRGVPAAGTDLGPLRRTSRLELVLAAAALAVAALLGTLSPPVSASATGIPGLAASGADIATTVRVALTALSNQPGPNRFVAHVVDYDSSAPVRGARVLLRFTPLDDPGVVSTSLALTPTGPGEYSGSGPNMTFDGRWEVAVLVQRRLGAVDVPLELDPVGAPQQSSVERVPDQAPRYTRLDGTLGFVRISPDPERAGPSTLSVGIYRIDLLGEEAVDQLVVTAAAGSGPTRQQSVRRVGIGSFVSPLDLAAGRNEIAIVARTGTGQRLRSVFDLEVPAR